MPNGTSLNLQVSFKAKSLHIPYQNVEEPASVSHLSSSKQHYAASVGAPNFICGIGEKCQAGQVSPFRLRVCSFPLTQLTPILQLCSPVQSPGWEVLVATQEWNNYQNKFYEAVGTAVQLVTCK
jgi:hypothetical protein